MEGEVKEGKEPKEGEGKEKEERGGAGKVDEREEKYDGEDVGGEVEDN